VAQFQAKRIAPEAKRGVNIRHHDGHMIDFGNFFHLFSLTRWPGSKTASASK
jgi:hypothetical protein